MSRDVTQCKNLCIPIRLGNCRLVWLSRALGPQVSLASRRVRWLGWLVRLARWLVGWLTGRFVGCLLCRSLLSWSVDGSIFCIVVRFAGCLVAWLVCFFWLAQLLGSVGWLAAWLAWLNPPTPGPKPRGPHREGSGRGPKINYHNIVLCFVEAIVKTVPRNHMLRKGVSPLLMPEIFRANCLAKMFKPFLENG